MTKNRNWPWVRPANLAVDDEPELVEHRRPEHAGERGDVGVAAVVVADCCTAHWTVKAASTRVQKISRRAEFDDALREPFLSGVAASARDIDGEHAEVGHQAAPLANMVPTSTVRGRGLRERRAGWWRSSGSLLVAGRLVE